MCGRARCTLNPQQIARACGIQPGDASVATAQMDRFRSSYNLSPGSYMPVVVRGGGDDGAAATIHCMKWGLVPGFTKKTEKPDHFRMFNARSESVQEKASFRRLVPKNRCLVAAEGFYEWKKDGSKKQPYYIHFKDQRPLVFAALYDCWESSDGEILHTFTILTTCTSPVLQWLHDRMPVILGNKDSINEWLDGSRSKFGSVLVPYEASDLVWYAVTPAIGKTSFDGPECIKELKPAAKNPISRFFSKKSDVKVKLGPEVRNSDETTSATELTKNLKEEDTCTEDTKDSKTILRHDGVNKEFEISETIKEEPCGENDRECLKKFKDSEVKKEADLPEAMKEVLCGKEELIKSQDSEIMKEADLSETIKEEPSGEEARECLKRYSDSEIKKEFGANRDFEKMAIASHPKVLKPTSKKKSRSIKVAGDGQSTLFSFFGKKLD